MTDQRHDPTPITELPFARQLEQQLRRAAAGPAPSTASRSPLLMLRRTVVVAVALAVLAAVPVVTSVVVSLLEDDGIPRATADLPVTGGDIEVVPMGEANGYFDVELATAPAVAQSIRVPEPTRVVRVEVSLTPPTLLDNDGTERFAPDGPPVDGSITASLWQAGQDVDLDGEIELRRGFVRLAQGTRDAPIPRQGITTISFDAPTVLSAGQYVLVLGFTAAPQERVLRFGVGGALADADDRGERYPDGQAFRAVDRGDDRRWFVPHAAPREDDGLPSRGDLQVWLRTDPVGPGGELGGPGR